MRAEQLLQHFERISEAPDAIKRLRGFILDLAVRGKLVEQEPADEPAAELLKRIAAEKARLVKAGKARKSEVDPVTNEEISFPVPSNWVWTRLGSIGDWGSGSTPSRGNSDLYGGGITWLKSGELNDNRALEGSEETVSKLAVEKGSFRINKTGDVLIAMYGATIGKVAILAESAVTNQAICGCTPFPGVFNQYLFFYLLSQRAQFHSASEGGAQPNISKVKIIWTTFPLPPLAEQHRIVEKVDELMCLCDQLEAAKAEREQCRESLVAASLQGLNQPAEEEETFREHARFTFNNLPRITTRAAHIKQLRQTILNLAVRGKLVEQDTNDEPASFLLDQILAQPWAKKRKTSAILPKKDLTSIAYPLPGGWCWAVVETLLPPDETVTYGILKPEWVTDGIPTVRVTEMKTGKINLASLKLCDPARAAKFQKTTLKPGDLLISKDGTIGKTAFVPPELAGSNITQHLLRYPISELVNRFFVKLAIDSPYCQQWMAGETKGVALKGVNVSDFRQMPLPLPPLSEQHRIVAKVDELMAICDQLEAQITVTEQDSRRFLESVLAEALAPGIDLKAEAQVA